MTAIKLFIKRMWRIWFFANAVITFLLFYPLFYFYLSKRKRFKNIFKVYHIWGRLMLFNAGITYKTTYHYKPEKDKTYIYCSNHASYLDVILIHLIVPYFHIMAKAELQKIPLFKKFFDGMNIPVERKSRINSHRAFIRAATDLENGISIALFPEGTIPVNAPHLSEFKNGPFRLAIEKKTPIVPITFLDNWRILPDSKKFNPGGRPGKSRIIVHPPVITSDLTPEDVDILKKKVYAIIELPLIKNKII